MTAPGRVSCTQLTANLPKGEVGMQDGEEGVRMGEGKPPPGRIRHLPLFGFNLYLLRRLQRNIWAQCWPDLIMCWELAFAAFP